MSRAPAGLEWKRTDAKELAVHPGSTGDHRVLVIIPAYNEEGSIGQVIERVRSYMPSADVLVVDDGSYDGTLRVAASKQASVVRLPFNCGIGTAMQTGYIFAQRNGYDIAIQIDADGQHDPSEASRLIAPIVNGTADISIGSRFLADDGYKSTTARRIGIAWLALLLTSITGTRVTDPTSGFRAAGRGVIALFARDYPTDYPEPEVLIPLHRNGHRFVELPVRMSERQVGSSSITAVRSAYYIVKVTLAILIGLLRNKGGRLV